MTARNDSETKEDSKRRLAEALRRNLRRRKAGRRREEARTDPPDSVAESDC